MRIAYGIMQKDHAGIKYMLCKQLCMQSAGKSTSNVLVGY